MLSRFLRRWVGTLHTATNGQEGAQAFLEHHPDVVVTDIKMPVMDGLEMASTIKASSREVPIIVITAYSERDYFIRAIEIGVDQYVTKPVNTDILLQAIYKSASHHLHKREMEKAEKLVVDCAGANHRRAVARHRAARPLYRRPSEAGCPAGDGHRKRNGHARRHHHRHPARQSGP